MYPVHDQTKRTLGTPVSEIEKGKRGESKELFYEFSKNSFLLKT